MKWLASWTEEKESHNYEEHEKWLESWSKVMETVTQWMSYDTDVIKGEIICHWNNGKMYGDGRPCLIYDVTDDNNDDYEDEDYEGEEDYYYDDVE